MYEALYEQNKGLLHAMAQRYADACERDRAVTVEDLMQAGFLGLVEAAETYRDDCGKTWVSWAVWHVRREIDAALGTWRGRTRRLDPEADALDRPLGRRNGEVLTLGGALPDERTPGPEEAALLEELQREVSEAVDRLGDEGQRRAVRLCRLEGYSCREAAAEMGLTPGRVRRLCDRGTAGLARDRRLRAMADLDDRTRFHAHKGVAAFNRDWTSVTEGAALWRIEQEEKLRD